MRDTIEKLGNYGLIPVVKIDNLNDAIPLAKALMDGGLPVAEITFRTAAAEEAIKAVRGAFPDMLVGAGTIINLAQCEKALAAGAQFVVAPGLDRDTVEMCKRADTPVMPGVATPSEVQSALGMGIDILKFFPAEALGGLSTLKAISAPLAGAKFVPLGGINPDNLNDYLSFPKVFACGGTWMVKDDLIKAGKFGEITALTRAAVAAVLGFELAHVGINAEDPGSSLEIAKTFSEIFLMGLKEGNSSNFAGSAVEVNKSEGPGSNGHIAIKTNSVKRAVFYLSQKGVETDMQSAKKSPDGEIVAVYLKKEIGGFAVHLLQKK